jgi:serine phosphatase RsbU (regulator of sigma subunit)
MDALGRFEERYADALRAYLSEGGEARLEQAYELGRQAFADSLSMLDIAAVHHRVLADALRAAPDGLERHARAAADFFIESLSTYEMTQRGFREANEVARMEREHAASLRGLADASVALNTAREPVALLELVTERARELIGANCAAISVVLDRDMPQLDARSLSPRYGDWTPDGPLIEAAEIFARALESESPVRLGRRELARVHDSNGSRPAWEGWMGAPLVGRDGRRLGLIELADKEEGEFTANDEAIVLQLAQMVAVALENARLYEREHGIATTLQQSLLPNRLPVIPGVQVAARYRPAGEGNEVGGDFYDVFGIGDGRWLVVIGDVCGKGPEAAAITALARYTVRATALRERRPSEILAFLNEAMLSQALDGHFCTVACAMLAIDDDGVGMQVCSGGHPLPLVIHEDGRVEQLGEPGTLLGVVADPHLADHDVRLRAGDAVVLYTDGVTDAAAPREMWTEEHVAGLLAGRATPGADGVAERLERAVLDVQERPRDDIAIVVVTVDPPGA